jgi:hypothetical protein
MSHHHNYNRIYKVDYLNIHYMTMNDNDTCPPGFQVFEYHRHHIPTGNSSIGRVACMNVRDFWALMGWWTNDIWRYRGIIS